MRPLICLLISNINAFLWIVYWLEQEKTWSWKCTRDSKFFISFEMTGSVPYNVKAEVLIYSGGKCAFSIYSLANQITAGQLLCGGLFSGDSLSNWFAAVALLHAISENDTQKEQLLRVQLATSIGSPPVSLLQQCCNILAQVIIIHILKSKLYNLPTHFVFAQLISMFYIMPQGNWQCSLGHCKSIHCFHNVA